VSSRPPSARRVVARFLAANLVIVAVLVAGSLWASHAAARSESLADACVSTRLLASMLVEPNLTDAVLTGDPQALAELDGMVAGPLSDAAVVRIKIWDDDLQIVYSDEPRLIGQAFPDDGQRRTLLRSGGMVADLSDLTADENVFEHSGDRRLLEVYRQVTAPTGERLLLETYFDYEQVTSRQVHIWRRFAPISAFVLVAMLVLQCPLVARMLRRVRQADHERLRLHARAADASTDERRRIASSLHDGVVQDLSAAPLFMSQAVDRLRRRPDTDATGDHAAAEDLSAVATAVRNSVASLRSLLIELYPPHLAEAGLPAALSDLADRVQARGIATQLQVPAVLDLPPEVEALLFRVAQEGLSNAVKHAPGSTVVLSLTRVPGLVTMVVRDDGAGFHPATAADAPGTGHFGMRVLTDLARAAGAALDLATAPGQGTALRLQVPLPT
jgi:two-component system NarL family sensor kinase